MNLRRMTMTIGRGLLAPGLAVFLATLPAQAVEPPAEKEAMVGLIRSAIEAHDYDALKDLVLWKDTGKIKKRIVRFHLNRVLGRKIKSIELEEFPADGMAGVLATGKLKPNMEITHQVRIIFDEPNMDQYGKPPTYVFLVGKHKDAWRIGLVNRAGMDDDDD